MSDERVSEETLARRFHEIYERLAPQFGYKTRTETRQFDPTSSNGKLMIAVCAELLTADLAALRETKPVAWRKWHSQPGWFVYFESEQPDSDPLYAVPQPAPGRWVPTKEMIIEAMQHCWDDWVADTRCLPDDFTKYSRGQVSFKSGDWARSVAERLLAAAPEQTP